MPYGRVGVLFLPSYFHLQKDDDGNEIDWRTDPKARDDYFNQVETDYTYFCYDQKEWVESNSLGQITYLIKLY